MTDASADIMLLMTVLDGAVQPSDAPGGVSDAVLNVALCGWPRGHHAAPAAAGQRQYQRADAVAAAPASRQPRARRARRLPRLAGVRRSS